MDTATSPQAMQTMRSVVQDHYGTDADAMLRLADVARPTIGDGDVLVRVVAASVDMGTAHLLTGMPYAMRVAGFGVRSPKAPNPGRAFAGTIESVGKDVTGFAPGDEVYGSGDGAFAEYLRSDTSSLAHKPATISFEQAAAAPISGGTALQAVRKANVRAGQKVLVTGASGGVGSFAVQIAKALGAEVTAVASTAKLDLVRSIGADHVLDHTKGPFLDGPERYDVVVDIAGNSKLAHLRRALTSRGTLVIVGGETSGRVLGGFGRAVRAVAVSPFVSQTLGILASKERSADLDDLRELIESARVAPMVERTYPLSEVAAAIRHVSEGRAHGKIAIAV